ncbi:hypothetical protein ABVK25_011629 [Lepraria finkii]|uniref:Uncharacterized protein n=1 Tax=Lepraria finkii TaxID=1340010 RepID=A0ABR4ALP0_9LECA
MSSLSKWSAVRFDAGGHTSITYNPGQQIPIGTYRLRFDRDIKNFKLKAKAANSTVDNHRFESQKISQNNFVTERRWTHNKPEYRWISFTMSFDGPAGSTVKCELIRN